MSDARPIGVFDSGLGGLTVIREIQRLMPGERVLYLGDTARCPYGERSEDTITTFGLQDAKFLMDLDIKLLIVACNTVSSVALQNLQQQIKEIPVIGVVLPGARAAVLRTAERKIGVIGTAATIRTNSYATAIHKIDKDIKVYGKPCPLFVPLVEEGLLDSDITRLVAQHYLYDMIDLGVDCLILGCTHYPLLMEVIQGTVGNRMQLLDSALWTAKEAQDILTALDALSPDTNGGISKSSFMVTDLTTHFEVLAEAFLGQQIPAIEKISLEELVK
ncbi:glutamate racemase [Chitinispirillales bacterium ANBcel5]|uniref:glutamate racemase n=1 Tax=Cellulosispirillum alkaliphilum TaxID=3039283 RepID=UPI002A546BB9|nr:glutamate racemase [Chitinispirillales bacterium ANBcel5]